MVRPTRLQLAERFMHCVIRQNAGNMTLDLHRFRFWHDAVEYHCPNRLDSEETTFNRLSHAMNGFFKVVNITIVYHTKTGNGVGSMMALAKRCAQRLLGGREIEHKICWSDEPKKRERRDLTAPYDITVPEYDRWERRLVASRKFSALPHLRQIWRISTTFEMLCKTKSEIELTTTAGLSIWFLSCKQVLDEILTVLSKTHVFQGELDGIFDNYHLEYSTPPPNRLIFKSKTIRHILVRPSNCVLAANPRSTEWHMGPWLDRFLYYVHALKGHDMSLNLEWDWQPRRLGDAGIFAAFRQVRIKVIAYQHTADQIKKMMAYAELRAMQLVVWRSADVTHVLGKEQGRAFDSWSDELGTSFGCFEESGLQINYDNLHQLPWSNNQQHRATKASSSHGHAPLAAEEVDEAANLADYTVRSLGTFDPQSSAPFFKLPQEIRDQIYEEAYRNDPRSFSHQDFRIQAYQEEHGSSGQQGRKTQNGLPRWILVCKKICTEAMTLFLQTRTFKYMGWVGQIRLDLRKGNFYHDRPTTTRNPLVFHRASVHKIVLAGLEVPPKACRIGMPGAGTLVGRMFGATPERSCLNNWLSLMETCTTQNLSAELVWDRRWHNSFMNAAISWIEEEAQIFDVLDDGWNGKCRKAKITIVYHSKTGNGVEKMIELAAACSSRLLGLTPGHTRGVWADVVVESSLRNHPIWRRAFSTERKHVRLNLGRKFESRAMRTKQSQPITSDRPDTLDPDPQTRSYFFSLPQELRNAIYTLILHTAPIHFNFGCLRILASTTPRANPIDASNSLPNWITSCKLICPEALSVFDRTRIFAPLSYDYRTIAGRCYPPPRAKTNRFVFNANVVRNMALHWDVKMQNGYVKYGSTIREFVVAFRELQVHDLSRNTTWIRTGTSTVWREEGAQAYGKWSKFWDGRCWKVSITVMVDWWAEEALDKMADLAKSCAKRLVGGDAVVVGWETLGNEVMAIKGYARRRVVVKKKA
ncbi:hypothetical protein EK21DRAFT_84636 [Setomelanomma holmii]|uniref:Uncharacterized protein n=1 Tax=Setomelanomma holmii TaxID=210430 RepID=A0A9P4HJV8_9PLEO|nr:hypothetical protein EK21DRAFT_84636 [Setomelanomma holmii]